MKALCCLIFAAVLCSAASLTVVIDRIDTTTPRGHSFSAVVSPEFDFGYSGVIVADSLVQASFNGTNLTVEFLEDYVAEPASFLRVRAEARGNAEYLFDTFISTTTPTLPLVFHSATQPNHATGDLTVLFNQSFSAGHIEETRISIIKASDLHFAPEPAPVALLGAGLLGLMAIARQRVARRR
jgi:hypothetical protein